MLHALRPFLPVALMLSACSGGPPDSAILARVDGHPISEADLHAEESATNSADVPLERLIERQLLAREAERRSIDTSPEFLTRYQRARDLLLADQLQARITAETPLPSTQAVDRYIAAHRADLASRKTLLIDRITTSGAFNGADLGDPADLDAVAARLQAHGLPVQRGVVTADSLDMPPGYLEAAGQRPRLFRLGIDIVIDKILTAQPSPVAPANMRRVATERLHDAAARDAWRRLNRDLHLAARIERLAPESR